MNKLVGKHTDLIICFILIVLFITFRSFNLSEKINFSADQGQFSERSLQIIRNHEITLVGPTASFNIDGHQLIQGSLTYYLLALFLIIGDLDPFKATYLFIIFAGLMVFPLYYGTSLLSNKKSALLLSVIYCFLPLFITYTSFLWNPNFQIALTPLLILSMGLYQKYKQKKYIFLTGFILGFLLQFHYQYLIIITGLFIYYFLKIKNKKYYLFLILWTILGLLPLIIFELKNNFYNFKTALLLLGNYKSITSNNHFPIHYLLSIVLFLTLFLTIILSKRLHYKIIFIFSIFLFLIALIAVTKSPNDPYGIKNWNYKDELKTYEYIKNTDVKNFNITNLSYDTLAHVQKYFILKDNLQNNLATDYYSNDYLFVISDKENYLDNSAYEVNTFKPSKLMNKWSINSTYTLYELKRLKDNPN